MWYHRRQSKKTKRLDVFGRELGCLKWSLMRAVLFPVCLLSLTGCMFNSVDEMYALPKVSESYVNLQAKINDEKGDAEYIAPVSGDNRQTIQLVDLDGDGVQEVITFFRDAGAEQPLKITVLKRDERQNYEVMARIAGVGSEIESVEYAHLSDETTYDILVSWQVSASVHTLVAYDLSGMEPVELMRSGYGRYLSADMDNDGLDELLLAQPESSNTSDLYIEYYNEHGGKLELVSSSKRSDGTADISRWETGILQNGQPALFVTSYFGKDSLLTDIFCVKEGGLNNTSITAEKPQSSNVFHSYIGVYPMDINKDGVIDVPIAVSIPSFGDGILNDFFWLKWMDYRLDGGAVCIMTTYHSSDGWYFEIPENWVGSFSMSRQDGLVSGVRNTTFAHGEIGEGKGPEPFLTISMLTGANRAELAQRGNRLTLYADTTTIYAAELLHSDWDCGLDEENVKQSFHANIGAWPYP